MTPTFAHIILYMNNMNSIATSMITTPNTRFEHERLGFKLPPEVEALIKEYAQPMYKLPSHFKAMNTLFIYQKRHLMRFALEWIYPSYNNPLRHTRFNNAYRKAQQKYIKQPIGEIYEELTEIIPGTRLFAPDWFITDILNSSRRLKFITNKQGRPVECNSITISCYNIYTEMLIVIMIASVISLMIFNFRLFSTLTIILITLPLTIPLLIVISLQELFIMF